MKVRVSAFAPMICWASNTKENAERTNLTKTLETNYPSALIWEIQKHGLREAETETTHKTFELLRNERKT